MLTILQVGDGTTSVVLLAGEILRRCKPFIEDNVHPQIIVRGIRKATQLALQKIRDIAVTVKKNNPEYVFMSNVEFPVAIDCSNKISFLAAL